MRPGALDALLDRVASVHPELPTVILSDSSIEPGIVMVAIRTTAGSAVIAVPAGEWSALRAADALGFSVPVGVRKMAQEVAAGRWTRDAQEKRTRDAAVAAEVATEKKTAAKPPKKARP